MKIALLLMNSNVHVLPVATNSSDEQKHRFKLHMFSINDTVLPTELYTIQHKIA
jgi:hypothetical protein